MKNDTQNTKKLESISTYKKNIIGKIFFLIVLAIVLFFAVIISTSIGSSSLTFAESIKTLFGCGTKTTNIVVFNIRLPRIITAVAVGIAMAMSGAVMQSVLKNPLASSSTLGVSQGASFGASFAIVCMGSIVGSSFGITNPYLVALFAFLGGVISTLIIVAFSMLKKHEPTTMILAGVALSALFSGGATLIQYFAEESILATVVYWTFGDLGRTNWTQISIILAVSFVAFIFFMFNSVKYNAMLSGSDNAKALGVNTFALTIISLLISTFVSAVSVAFVGIINFVGLIAPHMVKGFVGNDYRFQIPASALMGAIILVLSDLFGRMVIAPIILPIGAITSFVGAPIFLYLVFRGKKKC